ncbi:hypothetical protein GE09DRAFT_423227 [Coniochaeta sp. 2T2.1]|nr:hypothetical protein GE09DRAFT_423227 [Coniochaeta sp. 2T2.1]
MTRTNNRKRKAPARSRSEGVKGPCTHPKKQILHGPLLTKICGKCRASLAEGLDEVGRMEDGEEDNEAKHYPQIGPRLRKATGAVFPTEFIPPAGSANLQTKGALGLFSGRGRLISSWADPSASVARHVNQDADGAAFRATGEEDMPGEWQDVFGI